MNKLTAEERAATAALWTTGERLAEAREAQREAMEAAREAALRALAAGVSEGGTAKALGVDRMTVRHWQGKR